MKRLALALLLVSALFLTPNHVVPNQATTEPAEAPAEDGEELEEYVPSQKVSADHSISFPVDI